CALKIAIKDILIDREHKTTRRVRDDFGDLANLANSIRRHGLIHPIVVDELKDNPDYKYALIVGERRIRATKMLKQEEIEATLYGQVDDLKRKEMELEENIMRHKLSWQEEIEALRQLDDLKRMIYGPSTKSRDNEGWTYDDTAASLGLSKGAVCQDVKLARELKENPDIAEKVKNLPKTAARKVFKQEKERRLLQKQVDLHDISLSTDLRLCSCVDGMKSLENESVHLVVTDPPFASDDILSAASTSKTGKGFGGSTYNLTKSNVSDEAIMKDTYNKLIPLLWIKMVEGAHMYMFLGFKWYSFLTYNLRTMGFIVDDQPIIWWKRGVSITGKDYHYISSYEAILFCRKPGKRRVRNPIPNVIDISRPSKKIHPLQKPEELLRIFIENSSQPGELVVDCFAGSASTIVTARKLQRSAIGFEIDDGNFLRAQDYMRKELSNE
ncbi:MAG: DNA methyltransferase, partial [Candidatus Heimdallarchaeaceae archaeon]